MVPSVESLVGSFDAATTPRKVGRREPVTQNGESDYRKLGREIGALVESKQIQYGDSVGKTGKILALLYPKGVQPYQMDDALLIVRVLDKMSRISQRGPDGRDLGGESPWRDISGYGLLGWHKDDLGKFAGDAFVAAVQERPPETYRPDEDNNPYP
jgi:hypothetical protein